MDKRMLLSITFGPIAIILLYFAMLFTPQLSFFVGHQAVYLVVSLVMLTILQKEEYLLMPGFVISIIGTILITIATYLLIDLNSQVSQSVTGGGILFAAYGAVPNPFLYALIFLVVFNAPFFFMELSRIKK